MSDFSGALSSIPGLAGALASKEQREQGLARQMQQTQGVIGLLSTIQQREQQEAVQGILSQSGGDLGAALPALLKSGPLGIQTATQLAGLQAAMRKETAGQAIGSGGLLKADGTIVAPAARPAAPAAPSNVARLITERDGLPQDDPRRPLFDAAIKKETEVRPAAGTQPTTLNRLLSERDALPPGDPRRNSYDNAIRKESETSRQITPVIVNSGGTGKPPTGYRYKADGELEPIPGGPKDMSIKNKAVAETAAIKAKIVTDKVDEALAQTGFFSTGLIGEVLGKVPGTNAYDLDATLDTIKANIGFNELQAMRQQSPTGGALGQVAVRELDMLQATLASLKKGQSQPNLRNGLNQVKKHYMNWKNAVDQAAAQEGGSPIAAPPAAPVAAPAAPQPAGAWTPEKQRRLEELQRKRNGS